MTKPKGKGKRRKRHRVAPSPYTDQLNSSDSKSTQSESELQATSALALLQTENERNQTSNSTHRKVREDEDAPWLRSSSSSGKQHDSTLTLGSNLFNAELNIRPKYNESVAVYTLHKSVTVHNKSSPMVHHADTKHSNNTTNSNQQSNHPSGRKREPSVFLNPSDTAQVLEKIEHQELNPVEETPHPNACLACLNKCCRVCRRKRKVPPASDYVVKLDPELKDRMTSMLETTRDHYHSLEATLKAALASKNKSLIKTMTVKAQLHDLFANCENAVYLLHRVHFFCGDAIRTLSYYFETDMTADKLKKVQGKSVLGSYMWLITMCMQALHGGALDKEAEEFDEIKRTLEDIVGQSFVIWRGITHVVGAFIECRQKTEIILRKHLERWDPDKGIILYRQTHIDELQKLSQKERAKFLAEQEQTYTKKEKELKQTRKNRIKQIKLHNRVGDNELIRTDVSREGPLPPPPEVKIVRCRIGENIWVPFKDIRNVDRLLTLNQVSKKVVQILEEVHGHLRGMDKFLHMFSNAGEADEPDMSYLQAILRLNKYGKRLAKIHPSKLSQQDMDCLAILSRALIDELDLTEFLVMTLRSLIHETRHAIHVSYEYTRLFYPRSLLQYEVISPPDHSATCLEKLKLQAVFEDYEFEKIDFRSAVTQFNSSPYIELLKLFPVKEVRHLLMLKPLN